MSKFSIYIRAKFSGELGGTLEETDGALDVLIERLMSDPLVLTAGTCTYDYEYDALGASFTIDIPPNLDLIEALRIAMSVFERAVSKFGMPYKIEYANVATQGYLDRLLDTHLIEGGD
jgi:hypothetical protein